MTSFAIDNALNSRSRLDPPRLAVTLGDPAGIGPEVILKALADPSLTLDCQVEIVGCRQHLLQTYECLKEKNCTQPLADPSEFNIFDWPVDFTSPIALGYPTAATGAASFSALQQAIALTLAGQFQGIVTGPIAKSAWKLAGHHYPGQTELLAEMAEARQFGMLFVAESPHTGWILRTLLATTHIPLQEVPHALTPELLTTKLQLLVQTLHQDFGLSRAKIAIAGLNPHSGEQGQLGTEEQDWLIPWLEEQRFCYPEIELVGPVPPDTLWVKAGQAWFRGSAIPSDVPDAYLALYHDQGLIPVKLMAFDRAVNTTIGLPFIRTSPDHGTAFDIAGQGIADATSMKAAIRQAATLAKAKRHCFVNPAELTKQ
jgi:4-hydroxythreonine-4-phosphate dehydrogenase